MSEDVFHLSLAMVNNYNALQNFLSDIPDAARRGRGKNRSGASRPTHNQKHEILMLQDFNCYDCMGKFIADKFGKYSCATADHIIPWRYGSSHKFNTVFLCDPCNQVRNKAFETIEGGLPYIKEFFGTINE